MSQGLTPGKGEQNKRRPGGSTGLASLSLGPEGLSEAARIHHSSQSQSRDSHPPPAFLHCSTSQRGPVGEQLRRG